MLSERRADDVTIVRTGAQATVDGPGGARGAGPGPVLGFLAAPPVTREAASHGDTPAAICGYHAVLARM
jgi:hypothetical protein